MFTCNSSTMVYGTVTDFPNHLDRGLSLLTFDKALNADIFTEREMMRELLVTHTHTHINISIYKYIYI